MRLALCTALLLGGCFIDHHDSCTTVSMEVDTGATIDHTAGVDAGYYVSYTAGGAWHVEWTCDTKLSALGCEFSGSITSATLANAAPFKLESDDSFSATAGEVDWDTDTSTGIDGIDFTTAPGDTIHADLTIEGTYYPDLVFIPSAGQAASPNCLPVDLAPDSK